MSYTNTDPLIADIEKLIAALSSPDKWTKGTFARDKKGTPVDDHSPEATCFCLWGAIRTTGSSIQSFIYIENAIRSLDSRYISMASFNDDPAIEYEHVMAVLKYVKELREWELATRAERIARSVTK